MDLCFQKKSKVLLIHTEPILGHSKSDKMHFKSDCIVALTLRAAIANHLLLPQKQINKENLYQC
jgi:hypothetical protein